SLRESPSGCVTGKPSSRMTILRMPKPLRAFDPRIEMPISRGPFPCFTDTPGTSCRMSVTEKTGVLSKRVMSTAVAVCAPAPDAPGTLATAADGVPGFPISGVALGAETGDGGGDVASTTVGVDAGLGCTGGGVAFFAATFALACVLVFVFGFSATFGG